MKRMTADLGDHFMDRIRQLVEDTVDTCGHADMTLKETKAMVASVMAVATAETCSSFRLSRDAYLQLCEMSYEGREPRLRKRKASGRGRGL